MRQRRATLLTLLILLPIFLTPKIISASPFVTPHEDTTGRETDSELGSTTRGLQQSTSLSLLLSLDKNTYVRKETAVVTARVLQEQTPLPNALVTWEVDYPNGTLWFTWTGEADEGGFSTFEFLLALPIPSGKYTVCSTAFKEGYGSTSSSKYFTILNIAPEIHFVEVTPPVIEEPTTANIRANATDFEDGNDINVSCTISVPNSPSSRHKMIFDGTSFSLSYEMRHIDPTGTYKVTVRATDSEGASASPYESSFENAITTAQPGIIEGTVTDSTGTPIANASLTLATTDDYPVHQNLTDERGRYTFDPVPYGSYVLGVSADLFAADHKTIEISSGEIITANFLLLRLPIIWGHVKEPDETPIPDALVAIFSHQSLQRSSHSNESGTYRIVASEKGTFTVRASALGFASSSSIVTVYLESVTQLNFTLEKNGIVKGQVKDRVTGLPIPKATVNMDNQTHWIINTTTDESGSFSFSGVSPGNYTIRATAENYDGNSSGIQVFPGQTTFVELWLLESPVKRELEWVALIVATIVIPSFFLALFLRRKRKNQP